MAAAGGPFARGAVAGPMVTAREALARLAWEGGTGRLDGVEVVVPHRGAPGDRLVLDGAGLRLAGAWLETEEGTLVPFRVQRVLVGGRPVWSRPG